MQVEHSNDTSTSSSRYSNEQLDEEIEMNNDISDQNLKRKNQHLNSYNFQIGYDSNRIYPYTSPEMLFAHLCLNQRRNSFSEEQYSIIQKLEKQLLHIELPSIKTIRQLEAKLRERLDLNPKPFITQLGHQIFMTDIASICRNELSCPQISSNLDFYPELSQSRRSFLQSDKMCSFNKNINQPMIRIDQQDFYEGELCSYCNIEKDEVLFVPNFFYLYEGAMHTFGRKVNRTMTRFGARYNMEEEEYGIACSSLQDSWPFLHSRLNISFSNAIQGVHQLHSIREKANGCRALRLPLRIFVDDTSGNVSKRWNKHNVAYMTLANLPTKLQNKEENIHFLCASKEASGVELSEAFVNSVNACQSTGVEALLGGRERIIIFPYIFIVQADTPMASELCSHSVRQLFLLKYALLTLLSREGIQIIFVDIAILLYLRKKMNAI